MLYNYDVMKTIKEITENVKYVVATKTSYIYFGMMVGIISLVALLTMGSFLLSAILCPILSGALVFCVLQNPKHDDILGVSLGWSVIFILFLFG